MSIILDEDVKYTSSSFWTLRENSECIPTHTPPHIAEVIGYDQTKLRIEAYRLSES